jgi:hypothetical protein
MSWVVVASPRLKIFEPLRELLNEGDLIHVGRDGITINQNMDRVRRNSTSEWTDFTFPSQLLPNSIWRVLSRVGPGRYQIAYGSRDDTTQIELSLFDARDNKLGDFQKTEADS